MNTCMLLGGIVARSPKLRSRTRVLRTKEKNVASQLSYYPKVMGTLFYGDNNNIIGKIFSTHFAPEYYSVFTNITYLKFNK